MPAQSKILTHINSTFIDLDLGQWQDGGCPVLWYDVEYQLWEEKDHWTTVERQINSTIVSVETLLKAV